MEDLKRSRISEVTKEEMILTLSVLYNFISALLQGFVRYQNRHGPILAMFIISVQINYGRILEYPWVRTREICLPRILHVSNKITAIILFRWTKVTENDYSPDCTLDTLLLIKATIMRMLPGRLNI